MSENNNNDNDNLTTTESSAPDPKSLAHRGSSIGSLPDQMAHSQLAGPSVNAATATSSSGVTLVAKFAKERITVSDLDPDTTIGQVKLMIQEQTRILPKRQKLVGLIAQQGGAKGVTDDLTLSKLKVKGKKNGCSTSVFEFILMGTPEEEIFVDPADCDDLPDVIDDFDLDFNAGSEEWLQHAAIQGNLKQFTDKTEIHMMNPTRGKPLLVLDLDHTLLDFSSKTLRRTTDDNSGTAVANAMKRPGMDQFLTQCYQLYDLAVWSQTSWRWLETKLIELGMVSHTGYKFCFVLDKTSMFTVKSTRRNGTSVEHHVKPLQIIWSKLLQFNSSNTVHIDDLSRNFALNLSSGIQCTAYHRKKHGGKDDSELYALAYYLKELALAQLDFDLVDFSHWRGVCDGSKKLIDKMDLEDEKKGDGNGNGKSEEGSK
eukprot:CAMPEP_0198147544 /NCGR_PEP_ID=MMETSP1443-20131203/36490_1 /TAXON_ID=186043 /ORGANISM="Entomoneis sp., Strain CCMP2396" /LENGTH=427 /DNA_ID=CAMNT_0043811929 /DNA_START=11 /DNA_END=1294 /DNA_ORIENTATION=+